MLIEPAANLRARLNALIADPGGAWFEAVVILFKFGFEPGSATTFAELAAEEADFDGYAQSAPVVWGVAYSDDLKRAVVAAGSIQFTATGAVTPNTVGGYAVLNAAGNGILWMEKFAESRLVNEVGDSIIVIPKYVLGRQLAA